VVTVLADLDAVLVVGRFGGAPDLDGGSKATVRKPQAAPVGLEPKTNLSPACDFLSDVVNDGPRPGVVSAVSAAGVASLMAAS
jgi:hypothetical protein